MKLVLFLDITILFLVTLAIAKRKLNMLENFFILIMMEFLVTSYIAILYMNVQVWEVTKSLDLFIIFRIYEVITLPFLYLWYFNYIETIKQRSNKVIVTSLFIVGLIVIEWIIERMDVITYKNWNFLLSLLCFIAVLLFTHFARIGFRKLLRREGIGI